MALLHLFDRGTIEGSLDLPFDPELHDLLNARVSHLGAQGLLDMSELLIIDGNTHPAEMIAALGFDPLDGIGRARWGQPGYVTILDYVASVSPHYLEAIITVGNSGFAFQLLVRTDADPDLVAAMREQAACD